MRCDHCKGGRRKAPNKKVATFQKELEQLPFSIHILNLPQGSRVSDIQKWYGSIVQSEYGYSEDDKRRCLPGENISPLFSNRESNTISAHVRLKDARMKPKLLSVEADHKLLDLLGDQSNFIEVRVFSDQLK